MKIKDLKQQVGLNIPLKDKLTILYCSKCGNEVSANKGDYFMANDNTELKCCGQPLLAVRKEISFIKI